MPRPNVSVIVPFAVRDDQLAILPGVLNALRVDAGDQMIVADNRPGARPSRAERIEIADASGIPTPGFARNRGAHAATGEWLVFVDADTVPSPELIKDYFEPPPAAGTGVL